MGRKGKVDRKGVGDENGGSQMLCSSLFAVCFV